MFRYFSFAVCFFSFSVLVCLPFSKAVSQPLFKSLPADSTGISFQNRIVESPGVNIITYEYFYNGGGVGAGDFNNDGLVDLYFTGNMSPNKLYLNKGNFRFEDITKSAGVAGRVGWKTGVSVADVNGDGYLDIYVCYSGELDSTQRANQLFINNGDLTFSDKAKQMGVADMGYSTHAAFFDMDRDGDLDLYVLNHNIKNLRNFDAAYVKKMTDPFAGDHLYLNNNGKFINITQKAGIISNPLGYGLGIHIADINNDGWSDIYVSNDYVEEDYLYINNKNGTFTEKLKQSFGHLSNFSMGVDAADINNDGWTDIFTLDMLPEDNRRQKLLYAPDNYELYNNTLKNGFYHQLMRNMLQLNNGNGTFSEIGQLSGISNTDWSWAALFADFNHDGFKDLFVTNGYGRDMINRDFMKFYADERLKHIQGKTDSRMFQMLQGIKSTPLHNYIFENGGNLRFKDRSTEWGFDELNFSHGAAYVDLDNDGDLDLVMNRMNQEAGVYRNNHIESGANGHFIQLELKGNSKNTRAIGAIITVFTPGQQITIQNYPVHGFQSSMQAPVHAGFNDAQIDSIAIRWPDGQFQVIKNNVQVDTLLVIAQEYKPSSKDPQRKKPVALFTAVEPPISFQHVEDKVNDFKLQPLMPNMLSYSGPRFVRGDINGDKLEDIFVCGPKGQTGKLFIQSKDGAYLEKIQPAFLEDAEAEDCHAVFLDADKDGDQDLYVVSGGYAIDDEQMLQDRLYINEGGKFTKSKDRIPAESLSGAVAIALDFDADGDQDLFVGSRVIPGNYPVIPSSLLLENDGRGKFIDVSKEKAADFSALGMVTDAVWFDADRNEGNELVVVGEWMSPRVFKFRQGKMQEVTRDFFNPSLSGWWNCLKVADLDGDGDKDLVAGNWGINSQIKADHTGAVKLYYGDFDNNGFIDPLIFYNIMGKPYPMASRDELTDQMVIFRQRFPTYDSYADATLEDILDSTQRSQAKILQAENLETVWFENTEKGLKLRPLPVEANFSSVHAIHVDDVDKDGNTDLVLFGNTEQTRIKIGKLDASYGVLLKGNGKGNFKYIDQLSSGLQLKGVVRDVMLLQQSRGKKLLMIGRNNDDPVFYQY